ncbi:MAG: hypothetical protein ACRBF0_19910 [Calditrichia bacterium]
MRMSFARSIGAAKYYNSNFENENAYTEPITFFEVLFIALPVWIVVLGLFSLVILAHLYL